jgi:hypothetical protein
LEFKLELLVRLLYFEVFRDGDAFRVDDGGVCVQFIAVKNVYKIK